MKLGTRSFVWLVSAGVLLLGIATLVVSRTVLWSRTAGGWAGLAFLGSPMAPSWRPRPPRMERLRREGGGVVLWVLWDSPAAKAGIRRGDQIVEIDGIAVGDASAGCPARAMIKVHNWLHPNFGRVAIAKKRGERSQ